MVKKHMKTAGNRDKKVSTSITSGSLTIGQTMKDGSILAGVSPDTGRDLFAPPADAPLAYTFNQAQDYAGALDAHDHQDWRIPTKGELKLLFDNFAAIGGFDLSGAFPSGWYWSSSQDTSYSAWSQRFSDGRQSEHGDAMQSSLRCV